MVNKTGILLINLGTPDAPTKKDVKRYLNQFLTDGRVIDFPWFKRQLLVRGIIVPFRTSNSTALYKRLWTKEGSPLKIYGERVREMVQTSVGSDVPVALGMRYQNPSIEEAIKNLLTKQVSDLIIFPMFPQYASASTGSAFEEVMRILAKEEVIPSMSFIQDYYDQDDFIDIVIKHGQSFDHSNYDHILFSYHGIPVRQLAKADRTDHCTKTKNCCDHIGLHNRNCYRAQCFATTAALVKRLDLRPERYTTCFQSRLGKDPWTQPYTAEVLKTRAAKGDRRILVYSPAFVADCLETTIEVGYEYQEEFEAMGGEKLDLVPSLNDDPQWVNSILKIIREKVNLQV